ncbi:hypothetical protein BH24ACT5_BH24ACT5_11890 [soil metagenome]
MTADADAERDLDREFRAIAHALVHDPGARRAGTVAEMPNRRPIPLVAAALIVATGIGAVVALTGVGAIPQNGSVPTAPTLVPSSLDATTNETPFATLVPLPTSDLLDGLDVSGRISVAAGPAPMTRAAVSKVDGDAVVDLLTVTAGPGAAPPEDAHLGTGVIDGYAVGTFETTAIAYWGTDIPLSISGADPVSFLNSATANFVTAEIDGDGRIVLSFPELPAGYEVIANHALDQHTPGYFLTYGSTDSTQGGVSVQPNDPLLDEAITGGSTIRRTVVNGRDAWSLTGAETATVTWQPSPSSFATVRWDGSLDEAITIATTTEFGTDVAGWAARYDLVSATAITAPGSVAASTLPDPTSTVVGLVLHASSTVAMSPPDCSEAAPNDAGALTVPTLPTSVTSTLPTNEGSSGNPHLTCPPDDRPTITTIVVDQPLPESRFSQTTLPS